MWVFVPDARSMGLASAPDMEGWTSDCSLQSQVFTPDALLSGTGPRKPQSLPACWEDVCPVLPTMAPDLVWTDATVRADDKRIVLRVTEAGAKRDAMVSLPRGPHDLADEAQPDAHPETAPRRNHMVGQRVPARRGLTVDEVIEIIRAARAAYRLERGAMEAAE